MLTRINLLKIVWVFLLLALVENLGFPYMANHGHFDLSNEEFKPYLTLSAFVMIEILCVTILILKKPLPGSSFYTLGKIILPATSLTLLINTYRMIPMYWGITSTVLFAVQILVVIVSLLLSINFMQNRRLQIES